MTAMSRTSVAILLGCTGLALAAAADVNIPLPVAALEQQLATEPFRSTFPPSHASLACERVG